MSADIGTVREFLRVQSNPRGVVLARSALGHFHLAGEAPAGRDDADARDQTKS